MIQIHTNIYKIPEQQLFSKKEIFDELGVDMMTVIQEKYWCTTDGTFYNAILFNGKLYAKQFPEKDLYYKRMKI